MSLINLGKEQKMFLLSLGCIKYCCIILVTLAASDYNREWSSALKELDTWRVFESFPLPPPCCTVSWDVLVPEVSRSRLFLAYGVQVLFFFSPLLAVCLYD